MKYRLILLFFILSFSGYAQDLRLQKGMITDSVPIPGTDHMNYAIYLPEDYNPDREWPVIFVFDIKGKGKRALEAFAAAPGTGDFILVGSNNVQNTSYEANFYIAKKLFSVVLKNFATDSRRIYTSGFSGGARLATAIATISDDVKGVIACGAALPGNGKYMPQKNSFLFVGLTGDEEGNYQEMKNTVNILKDKKFRADLLVYDGASYYPPAEYMDKAVRTLTLKGITEGTLPGGKKVIDSLFKADMEFNKSRERKGRALYAFNDIEQLMDNYDGYVDKKLFRERRREIRKTPIFRKQRSDSYGISEMESNYITDYLTFLSEDMTSGNMAQLPSWEEEMRALGKLEKGTNKAQAKMAKRLKNMLTEITRETIPTLDREKDTDRLLFANAFLVLLDPGAEDAYLEVLRYSVKKSEYGMALFYLEQLLQNGFKDVKRLNADEDLALLRILPEYSDILEENGLKSLY